MAYNVMVEVKKGVYVPLDISKSKLFVRTSRFKETRYSLDEIDRFTSNFESSDGLRKHMFEADILDPNDYEKPLSIRIPKKGEKPKKVMYDFLYQNDRKYLDDPSLLIRDIRRMQTHNDFVFCLDYVLHFWDFYDCRDIAPELRYFFEKSLRCGVADNRLYELDENGDIPIVRMTKQLIYKYHHNYGNISYQMDESIKYRNFHEIIAFCEHFHSKRVELEKEKTKVKTLKKEYKQISFEE